MILGPIGQKWVCAAGVERSTLHRCGLTGQGSLCIIPFLEDRDEGIGCNPQIYVSLRTSDQEERKVACQGGAGA